MTADNVAIFRKEKDENGNVLFTPCGYDKEKNLVTNSNNVYRSCVTNKRTY